MAFPRTQTLFLGLSLAQAKLELLTSPDKPNLNIHYSTKMGSFTALNSFPSIPPLSKCLLDRLGLGLCKYIYKKKEVIGLEQYHTFEPIPKTSPFLLCV